MKNPQRWEPVNAKRSTRFREKPTVDTRAIGFAKRSIGRRLAVNKYDLGDTGFQQRSEIRRVQRTTE